MRLDQTAMVLHNGKVLIAGGQDSRNHAINTAELYESANAPGK